VPNPPRRADLKARIIVQIKRDGYSFIAYDELRAAWPGEFATAMQFAVISGIAQEENWNFEFLGGGIRFTPRAE
jgi:hypothetical protein